MNIAVLSDIHSNLIALKAVLADIETQNVQYVIIAGDHVGDGPHPGEVLRVVTGLDAIIIRGNKEEYILNYDAGFVPEWEHHQQMAPILWTYHRLDRTEIDFLRQLPDQTVVGGEGMSPIRVVHGSPDDVFEQLDPERNPQRVEDVLAKIGESVLVCGHTHKAWHRRYGAKFVVNPGSVGLHFNQKQCAEYAILRWDDREWKVEHREVPYDLNRLEECFQTSGLFRECRIWSQTVLWGLRNGRNITLEFLAFAYRLAEEAGYRGCKYVPDEIWELAERTWDWKHK